MALLLRLAAALDRRPAAVIGGLRVRPDGERGEAPSGITITLLGESPAPGQPPADLSLECWSLRSCAEIVLEATGLQLRVLGPEGSSLGPAWQERPVSG
jgi:exopolyphosphatase / guanosine-5'-triphosphate,3'-diphosphate pyrophosphatase